MDTREINIETYWCAVVRQAAEFHQISVAENPEFKSLFECILQVLGEGFIEDATEYGIERWESMLGIVPQLNDTLEDRKVKILTYLTLRQPYTWRVLQQMITAVVGEGNFKMSIDNETQTLHLNCFMLSSALAEMVKELLSRVVPMNLVINFEYYQQVEYLESSGTQYIDTGIIPTPMKQGCTMNGAIPVNLTVINQALPAERSDT